MRKRTFASLFAVAALAVAVLPLAARAAGDAYQYHYRTQMTSSGDAIGYAGTLDLNISPDGIVRGQFRADSGDGPIEIVSGGRDGNKIWFDIGQSGKLRVTATFGDTTIKGLASSDSMREPSNFMATLIPASGMQTYSP
jgi:hypothetical protein